MQRWLILILITSLLNTSVSLAMNPPTSNIQKLRQSLTLGEMTFPATTSNQNAKEHFLLGAAFLHAFMYDLAIIQFKEAQRLDPGFAMSYWGEAMAYKHAIWNYEDLNSAQSVLKRYEQNKDQRRLTEKEKRYLQAVKVLFSTASLQERDTRYQHLMQHFYQDFPEDANVGAFYALSLLGLASDFPNDPSHTLTLSICKKLIDDLFAKFPNHPGVLHYYLHFHDVSNKKLAKAALPAAQIALKVMRSSSHVTHMASHIYRRMGYWDDYILANKISVKAADNLCKTLNKQPLYACNAENKYHSLEWLHDGYLRKHAFNQANALVKQMEVIVAKDTHVIYKQWYYRMWSRQILTTKNWLSPNINIEPITQKNDQLYWSAYSECSALLTSILLDIHQHHSYVKKEARLNQVIEDTQSLKDPYIKQSCQIAKIEVEIAIAKQKGDIKKVKAYQQTSRLLQQQLISTELTPSLPLLPEYVKQID